MKKLSNFLITAILATLFSFSACSGDDVSVTGVTLDKTITSVAVRATVKLTESVQPCDATNKNVSWSSSDDGVASVSDGTVSGVAPGSALITATTEDGGHKATCAVTVFIPPAIGVSLNKTAAAIIAGLDERLTATVAPLGASQSVTWASSNQAVASIAKDGDGMFIAVGPGTANITATTADGKHTSAPCVITVTPNDITAIGITVVPPILRLMAPIPAAPEMDTRAQLTSLVDPPNAPAATITWSSGDPAKATVSATGFVTALAAGKVDIIASYGSGENAPRGICSLTIADPVRVTGVTVTPASADVEAGKTTQLTAAVTPANAAYPGVIWSSGSPAVASVSNIGLVTGLSVGEAIITATTIDLGRTSASVINVTPAPVTGVSLKPKTQVLVGGARQLTANVLPAYAANKNVTWRSNNQTIAAVDANGLVTGVSAGNTTITVTTEDGGFTATCEIIAALDLENDIYVAGMYNEYFVFPWWAKNGQTWRLQNIEGVNPWRGGASNSIAVADDESVYVAGWHDAFDYSYSHQAVLWKDGDPNYQLLANPYSDEPSEASSVFISGADIYIAGHIGNYDWEPLVRPYLWRNNNEEELPTTTGVGMAASVAVSGGIVYTVGADADYDDNVGYYMRKAALWENGILTRIHPDWANSSTATSVSVSGGNVYAAGYAYDAHDVYGDYPNAVLWKNGAPQKLPFEAGEFSVAECVFADGDTTYVAGYIAHYSSQIYENIYVAVLWVDGEPHYLTDPADENIFSRAYSVYVSGGKVYVSGYIQDRNEWRWDTVVWEDKAPKLIAPAHTEYIQGNYALSVFAAPW